MAAAYHLGLVQAVFVRTESLQGLKRVIEHIEPWSDFMGAKDDFSCDSMWIFLEFHGISLRDFIGS